MTRVLSPSGWRRVDLSSNTRLPVFVDLVRAMHEAESPRDVLNGFIDAMRRAYGRQAYLSLSTRGVDALAGEFRITQWSDETHREFVDRAVDPWSGEGASVQRGGLLGELVRHPDPTLLHDLAVASDPALGEWIASYRSLMAVPLMDSGVVTNWAILFNAQPQAFGAADLEDFVLRTSLIVQSITSLRAAQELRAATRWIEHEVDQIAAIQRAMLPAAMPRITGVTLAADYRTYDRAGGDYYAALSLSGADCAAGDPDGQWVFLIADASGHGPAAAVVMAMMHAMVWTIDRLADPSPLSGPGALLAHLNNEICDHGIDGSFVTALAAFYDPTTRRFRYASAGHPPPLVKTRRSSEACRRLDAAGGLPLGVIADSSYEESAIVLSRGQTVVLYTDGISEAMSPPPPKPAPNAVQEVAEGGWAAAELRGEMFGIRGIERALETCTGEPKCVIGTIFESLREHEGGLRPADDQTILAIGIDDAP